MKNNSNNNSDLKTINVFYKFSFPNEECLLRPNVSYIGNTIQNFKQKIDNAS